MGSPSNLTIEITPQVLLKAYACGIFPMAESAGDPTLYWIEPERRGILALDNVHVPRRLARVIRQEKFEVRVDSNYEGVIEGCASSRAGRRTTWINKRIRELYAELFDMGFCHTIESWHDGKLVGGLYGVALGRAFFGESMFSYETDASKVALIHLVARLKFGGFCLLDTQFVTDHLRQFGESMFSYETDASKVALIYLVARLKYGGFCLLDTQFVTDHLRQFGAQEISRAAFHRRLEQALQGLGEFGRLPADVSASGILQLVSQTSNVGCSTA